MFVLGPCCFYTLFGHQESLGLFQKWKFLKVCKLSFWTQKDDYLHSTEHIATGWLNGVELACFHETKTEVLATVPCFLNLFLAFIFRAIKWESRNMSISFFRVCLSQENVCFV